MRSIRSKGFTLLELLVVLVIISLTAGLVGPRIAGSLSGTKLNAASRRTAAALRWARSRAAAEMVEYKAVFDFETDRLFITADAGEQDNETGSALSIEENGPEGKRSTSYRLPGQVRFDAAWLGKEEIRSEQFELRFHADGGSSGGKVILSDGKRNQAVIRVNFITGAVSLASQT